MWRGWKNLRPIDFYYVAQLWAMDHSRRHPAGVPQHYNFTKLIHNRILLPREWANKKLRNINFRRVDIMFCFRYVNKVIMQWILIHKNMRCKQKQTNLKKKNFFKVVFSNNKSIFIYLFIFINFFSLRLSVCLSVCLSVFPHFRFYYQP